MKEPADNKEITGRNLKGQFIKGNQAARGRPKGSKNKTTLLAEVLANECEQLLVQFTPKILKLVIEQAMEGCKESQKRILERAVPIQKATSREENTGNFEVTINVGALEREENIINSTYKEE